MKSAPELAAEYDRDTLARAFVGASERADRLAALVRDLERQIEAGKAKSAADLSPDSKGWSRDKWRHDSKRSPLSGLVRVVGEILCNVSPSPRKHRSFAKRSGPNDWSVSLYRASDREHFWSGPASLLYARNWFATRAEAQVAAVAAARAENARRREAGFPLYEEASREQAKAIGRLLAGVTFGRCREERDPWA